MFFNNSLNAVQSNPSCANMQKSMTNSTINTNTNGGSSSFYQNNGLAESGLHGGGLGAAEKKRQLHNEIINNMNIIKSQGR